MPEERDALVRKAFQHYALRSRRPTVWIPRDEIGVSDDEILRTKDFSEQIWISNEHTALDSKVRVIYGRAPPDFSSVDGLTPERYSIPYFCAAVSILSCYRKGFIRRRNYSRTSTPSWTAFQELIRRETPRSMNLSP